MDENLHKRCLQFIIDRDAVKAAFPMGNSAFYPVCASLFTDKGIPADTAHLKSCYKLYKESSKFTKWLHRLSRSVRRNKRLLKGY